MVAQPGYLVDNLVASCISKYALAVSQNTVSQNDIVLYLDEELRSDIIPLIESVRGEYFMTYFDQPVTGAASYTIPQRAAGGTLQDVVFVDSNNNEIALASPTASQVKGSYPGYMVAYWTLSYYQKNDQIVLFPQNAVQSTGYTLRMKFSRRPNDLTLSSNCGQIVSINGAALTLSNIDTTWTTGTTFDIIQNFPQFWTVSDGQAITSLNGNVMTLSSVPTGLAAGMWVAPTLMSPIPQIPREAFPKLVQRGIIRMAEAIGDSQAIATFEKRDEEMKADLIRLLSPRVKHGTKKIINRNFPPAGGFFGGGYAI